jgi:hypothetical protein
VVAGSIPARGADLLNMEVSHADHLGFYVGDVD